MSLFGRSEALKVDTPSIQADEPLESLTQSPEAAPVDYASLLLSGKRDLDAEGVEEALFLFALHMVRTCPSHTFMEMGHRYCPHWRQHMAPEAWALMKEEIKARLKAIEQQNIEPQQQEI